MPGRLDDLRGVGEPDARHLVPPPRFGDVTFDSFVPQHPSQAAARRAVQSIVDATGAHGVPEGRGRSRAGLFGRGPFGRRREVPAREGRGLYLDGGFGVGKTHLLAAAFHAARAEPKRYVSFQELVYLIGVMGMPTARERLGDAALLCIDEFELDDPGNTLIVKTFLSSAFERGATVLTTANTPPAAQGEGRFNAEDFRREIQSLAERFEVVRVDGPDARPGATGSGSLLSDAELPTPEEAPDLVHASWTELLDHLGRHHPSRFRAHVDAMQGLVVAGAGPIADQADALRFVHFVDVAYDATLPWYLSGGPLAAIFDPAYRHGAYAKKYGRCLSRLAELADEARARRAAAAGRAG